MKKSSTSANSLTLQAQFVLHFVLKRLLRCDTNKKIATLKQVNCSGRESLVTLLIRPYKSSATVKYSAFERMALLRSALYK